MGSFLRPLELLWPNLTSTQLKHDSILHSIRCTKFSSRVFFLTLIYCNDLYWVPADISYSFSSQRSLKSCKSMINPWIHAIKCLIHWTSCENIPMSYLLIIPLLPCAPGSRSSPRKSPLNCDVKLQSRQPPVRDLIYWLYPHLYLK